MPSVFAKLGLDSRPFKNGLDEARHHAEEFSSEIGKMFLGAFAVERLFEGIESGISKLARVGQLSERFGESAESIQRVGNAAELAGIPIDNIAKIMSRLTTEAAKSGDKFDILGISASRFIDAPLEEKVLLLARAMEEAQGDQTKMVALMDILGGRGQDVLTLLAQGSEKLAAEMGGVTIASEGAVRAAHGLEVTLKRAGQAGTAALGWLLQSVSTLGAGMEYLGATLYDIGQAFIHPISFDPIAAALQNRLRLAKAYQEIWHPSEEQHKPRAGFDADEFGKDSKAGREAEEHAAEHLRELNERIILERLEGAEKIRAIENAIIQLHEDYDSAENDAERYKIAAQILEKEQLIYDIKKHQDEATQHLEEAERKAVEDKLDGYAKVAALQEDLEAAQDALDDLAEDEITARAKAAEKILTIEQEIFKTRKAADEAAAAQADKIAKSKEAVTDEVERQKLERLKPKERRAELHRRQVELYHEAAQERKAGHEEKANEITLKALKINDELDKGGKRPSVISSTLGALGGGGGFHVNGGDPVVGELREQTKILKTISGQLAGQGGHSSKTAHAQPVY